MTFGVINCRYVNNEAFMTLGPQVVDKYTNWMKKRGTKTPEIFSNVVF